MKEPYPDPALEQWKFLVVLDALGGVAHINILDALAPLTARQLIDLLKKATDQACSAGQQ